MTSPRLRTLADRCRKVFERLGPAALLDRWEEHRFDVRNGTDTSRYAELRRLAIDSPNKRHGERYQPSPVHSLRVLLKTLGIDHRAYTFVDFGSGKGRTLLIAGELPFRRVVGVEFSPELNDCARQNLLRCAPRLAASIDIEQADATQFELPPGPLVLYFFKPFTRPVLDAVLERVMHSLRDAPRPMRLVSLWMDNDDAFDRLAEFRLQRTWRRFRVHAFDPPVAQI